MSYFAGASWADWVQAIAAIVACLSAPALAPALWQKIRYRLSAKIIAIDTEEVNGSRRWQVVIENRSRKMRDFTILIYPSRPKNNIIFGKVVTQPDGGHKVGRQALDNGAMLASIDRLGARRTLILHVVAEYNDIPRIHAISGNVGQKVIEKKVEYLNIDIMHMRLAVLLAQFTLIAMIIIVRLVFFKIFY